MRRKRSIAGAIFITTCLCAYMPASEIMAQQVNHKDTFSLNAPLHNESIINAADYKVPVRRGAEKFESTKGVEHLFFSAAAGIEYLPNVGSGSTEQGPRVMLYAGNWITPVIGYRGGFDYSMWRGDVATNRIGISADYLINLSAFTARYNPKRLFEVVAVMGASY